ncbi:hypothetical protein BT96DRAFT_927914 [Gymnopus androsaceus JB14]|uniref:Uncharacterized protein n=1 Tax=Gymnopus androsaceus JB14 TaxID=1447944 RepID=A0A6A4GN46_9AGAR|nr:hypothetical protein BT96DRAFT_927914 [Gymnopus androsaceus JB14]
MLLPPICSLVLLYLLSRLVTRFLHHVDQITSSATAGSRHRLDRYYHYQCANTTATASGSSGLCVVDNMSARDSSSKTIAWLLRLQLEELSLATGRAQSDEISASPHSRSSTLLKLELLRLWNKLHILSSLLVILMLTLTLVLTTCSRIGFRVCSFRLYTSIGTEICFPFLLRYLALLMLSLFTPTETALSGFNISFYIVVWV